VVRGRANFIRPGRDRPPVHVLAAGSGRPDSSRIRIVNSPGRSVLRATSSAPAKSGQLNRFTCHEPLPFRVFSTWVVSLFIFRIDNFRIDNSRIGNRSLEDVYHFDLMRRVSQPNSHPHRKSQGLMNSEFSLGIPTSWSRSSRFSCRQTSSLFASPCAEKHAVGALE